MHTITIDWINAVGWTLLHSIWQSLIILTIVAGLLRFGSRLKSGLRYAIACGGLLLIMLVSALTFMDFARERIPTGLEDISHATLYRTEMPNPIYPQEEGVFTSIVTALEQNMPWIVLLWLVGFSLFALRTLIGIFTGYGIRSDASPIGGEWAGYVQRTAYALGMKQIIRIAESTRISGPMVMGYLKPLILIPVGMIDGLPTQQLETIFLHELAHIRRHDYLVNVLQILVESIFFFNPFVRILSNIIRREREYCCDDFVVSIHGNTSAYAHALVSLAESQQASSTLALSFAGKKNELLSRIKRIMEQSVRTYTDKRQLVIPVLFVLTAFASISWMSAEKNSLEIRDAGSSVDTVTNDDDLTARYSRISIITIDANGLPHEQIVEAFHGDEELKSLMEGDIDPLFKDTIPPFAREEWDAFAEAFNNEFRQDFQRLFNGDGDPHKLMEEFRKGFHFRNRGEPFNTPADSLNGLRDGNIFKNFREEFERFRDFRIEEMEQFRKNFRSSDDPIQKYERTLRDELIEDGYLSPHDRIEALEWNDESFKVNGRSLREKDIKKYNDLQRRTLEGNQPRTIEQSGAL